MAGGGQRISGTTGQGVRHVFALLVLAAVVACTDDRGDEWQLARGAQVLAPFKQEMKQALVAGLKQGPVAAISVCSEQAPAIAATLSVDGVRLGRSSHRLRNPDNDGPAWVEPLLAHYLDGGERVPRIVRLDGDRIGYVEAIETQPMCLVCHGNALAPELAAALKETYPDDRATGFSEGDLRGVFWAEFPRQTD